ncbi:MAG: ABC transporter ATP-binding protein [Gracilibacter sp. BRH_c7a]|nr:MAG: ABC transporter ATP-binding protein [Gracilibacter sp. BRH_c7a]
MKSILAVKNINKTFYSDWGEVEALRSISFACSKGEFISIVGPSGCGKTTLLRIIAGLENPNEGEISIEGNHAKGPGNDRAVVFQDPRLFPWLTVEKNAAFGIQNLSKEEVKSKLDSILKLVGLENFRKAFPYELSGGMAQRVAIARAVAFKPKVLLMDEPFSALDAQTRARMQLELVNLWQKTGKNIILVTHDINEALLLSQKVLIMSSSPGTIKETVEVPFSYPRDVDTTEFLRLKKHITSNVF